jgi:hypothetical protein
VRLIATDGSQLGVHLLPAALQMARQQDLDLVEVAPNADPPVCKIMDYERYKYEQQQKRRESKHKRPPDDPGPGPPSSVREPRNPRPNSPSTSASMAEPEGT